MGRNFWAQILKDVVLISAIWYKDGSQFLPSGTEIGIDFQTLVPNWYIDGSNFRFEARYKSNQDYGAPAAPPNPMFMEWAPGIVLYF